MKLDVTFRPDWDGLKCFARSLDFLLRVVKNLIQSLCFIKSTPWVGLERAVVSHQGFCLSQWETKGFIFAIMCNIPDSIIINDWKVSLLHHAVIISRAKTIHCASWSTDLYEINTITLFCVNVDFQSNFIEILPIRI